MKKPSKMCGYCGTETENWTRDHIVPVTLWGRGHLPKHPAVVPACEKCQLLFDVDAEYFRNCLIAMMREGTHAVADRLLATTVKRSIQRNRTVRKELSRNGRIAPITSKGGIIVGTGFQIEIDMPRFNRIIEKIIRGIYFFKSQKILPSEYQVDVYPGNGFWDKPDFNSLLGSMSRSEHFGDDVFAFRYVADRKDTNRIMFLLYFYGDMGILAGTELKIVDQAKTEAPV
jgi:hypothetical protein